MSDAITPLMAVDYTMTAGPLFLGMLFAGILFGILCVQIYFYYLNFPDDPRVLKMYVMTVFIAELLDQFMDILYGWRLFGSGWGNPQDLLGLHTVEAPLLPLTGIIASLAHAFYCWRIYKLSHNWILPSGIMLLSMLQMTTAFVYQAFLQASGGTLDAALRIAIRFGIVWLSGATAADIIITITIVILLSRARKRSAFRGTSFMIQSAILFAVETGSATSCCALAELTMFFALNAGSTNNNVHIIFFQMLSKLYSNSLVAALNSRALTSRKISQQQTFNSDTQFRSTFWSDHNTNHQSVAKEPAISAHPPQKIQITTQKLVIRDDLEMDNFRRDAENGKDENISKNRSFLQDAE